MLIEGKAPQLKKSVSAASFQNPFLNPLSLFMRKKVPWSCLLKTLLVQVSGAGGNQTAPFWQKVGRVMGELTETAPTQRDPSSCLIHFNFE